MVQCRRIPQFLAVLSATLSTISDGMQYAWTAPIVPILERKDSPISIKTADIFWLEYIYFFGGMASLPFTIYCVNKFGRKRSIIIAAFENLLAWILIGTASSLLQLFFGRFISGFASVVAFVASPMYIAEIADKKIRGFLGAVVFLMMLLGILLFYIVAPLVSVQASSVFGATFVIMLLLTFPFMPESPYGLLLRGDEEGARKSLNFLRCNGDVEEELAEISAAVTRQQSEKGSLLDIVRVRSNRKAVIIMVVLNSAQHFAGITVLLMNINIILDEAGSPIDPTTTTIFFATAMLLSAFISACVMDRLGRRFLLILSAALSGMCMLVLATYFCFPKSLSDWIPVVVVVIYAAVFKFGLGLVPIVTTGELFPTSVKGIGMALADCTYITVSCLSVFVFQVLSLNFGICVPFFLFAVCSFITAIFCYFYVPETTGKTLEEIQMILKGTSYKKLPKYQYGSLEESVM